MNEKPTVTIEHMFWGKPGVEKVCQYNCNLDLGLSYSMSFCGVSIYGL